MNCSKNCKRPNPALINASRILALLAVLVFGTPDRLRAEASATNWFEMVHICARVISEQSIRAFDGFTPAPFTMGMPKLKEYSIYNDARDLVVIARVEKDEWTHCEVREPTENDRTRWRKTAEGWENGFDTAFPEPGYRFMRASFDPRTQFSAAIHCNNGNFGFIIRPSIAANFHFRVNVDRKAVSNWASFCTSPGN